MIKKKYFKAISLVTAVAISISLFVGCSSKKDDGAGSSEKAATTDNGKITDKPIEISILMPGRPEGPISNDMPIIKEITKKTNVSFKWEQAPSDGNQYKEKFNIMVASGDIPDIMINDDKEVVNQGGVNGVFEPMNDYMDKYMPELKKKLQERGVDKLIKNDDGKYYYLTRLTAVKTNNCLLVRQDWLDKLGLKAPTTPDELYNVLKAFKERDPNGNGKADEIPYTSRDKFNSLNPFIESYGGVYSKDEFFVEDNKVKYTYTDQRYKKGLEFVNKLYNEKLIDNEYATNDLNIWQSRLTNGTSGMTWDVFVRAEYLNNIIKKTDPKANFVCITPLKNDSGKIQTRDQQNPTGKAVAISSKSKYKVEISKFFNWMYTDEGIMLTNFGVEGDHYNLVNGQPQYTDKIMKDPNSNAITKLCLEGWRDYWPYYTDIRYENAMGNEVQNKARDEMTKYIIPNFPNTLTYTDEESKVITSKYTPIKTYNEEMRNKYVMGTESLSKFDDFVKKIDQMGIQDVLKVKQSSYDRYIKR